MKNFLKISFFLLLPLSFLSAQPTMDEMLDDGKAGGERLLLKVNPTAMLIGDFPIYAELRLLKRFSIEAGAGFQAGYFLKEWVYYLSGDDPFLLESGEQIETGSGYSLRVMPKYYIVGGHLQGLSIGAMWRKRQYGIKGTDNKIGFTDLCLVFSQQVEVRHRIWVDYYLGIGPRSVQLPEGLANPPGTTRIAMPWGIKVGYGF